MIDDVRLLLISGSTRAGSTNTAVLRTAQAVAPAGTTADLFPGLADLPAFNPDDDHPPLHPAVAGLRQAIAGAEAVLICTPEYAGALPGSFKNLLDWTVGGTEITDKAVAWINASSVASPTGGADAHRSLAKVLGYVGADVVEAACRRIPMSRDLVGPDGTVAEPQLREQIADAVRVLLARRPAEAGGTSEAGDPAAWPAPVAPPLLGRSPGAWWGVVLEAPDATTLADFYVRLLGWTVAKNEPDFVAVVPPDGVANLAFQSSPEYVRPVWPPEPGQQQTMLHLDIEVDDLETATAHAVAAGATVAGYQPQDDVRVLLDPAGHAFCFYTDGEA
jgi:chromate reductase, NAD(P)H dehydrogenase (quinone)